jgi:hypothetical protein
MLSMLWRRFRVFASLWLQLFAWGHSRWQRLVKIVGLLLAFLALFGTPTVNPSISVYFWHTDAPAYVFPVHIGVVIGALVLIAWALITAAIAWERSGVPTLIVADDLEWDRIRFRLMLEARDKPVDTSVRLLEIRALDGRHIFEPSRLNLDLEWTHHGNQTAIHIRANERESVSVATIHDDGRNVLLKFTGATYSDTFLVINKAFFHLRIANSPQPIDRWFSFTPNGKSFDVANESPPFLAPQNQLQSPTRALTE